MAIVIGLEIRIIAPVGVGIREVPEIRVRERLIMMTIRSGMSMNTGTVTWNDHLMRVNEAMRDRKSNGSEGENTLEVDFRVRSRISSLVDSSSSIDGVLFLILLNRLSVTADLRLTLARIILYYREEGLNGKEEWENPKGDS